MTGNASAVRRLKNIGQFQIFEIHAYLRRLRGKNKRHFKIIKP